MEGKELRARLENLLEAIQEAESHNDIVGLKAAEKVGKDLFVEVCIDVWDTVHKIEQHLHALRESSMT